MTATILSTSTERGRVRVAWTAGDGMVRYVHLSDKVEDIQGHIDACAAVSEAADLAARNEAKTPDEEFFSIIKDTPADVVKRVLVIDDAKLQDIMVAK